MLPKKNCTGCLACVDICKFNYIPLNTDRDGFIYPKINQKKCIQCKQCESICPVDQCIEKNLFQEDFPDAYAAFINDDDIRKVSSSGGIFTVLAEYVIKQKGIVYGAVYKNDLLVAHVGIDNKSDLRYLRGSKYVQSDMHGRYSEIKQFLERGRLVLFSGTPCQVEGVRSYLGKEYSNLITVDIICHGVPSPKIWKDYLRWQERKYNSKVVEVNFRDKCSGWKNFSLSLKFKNGDIYHGKLDEDPYMRVFLENYSLRESCYQCKFKTKTRISDLTLGDFWGIEDVIPMVDDDKGVSVIFIQSDKGKHYFDLIKEKLHIEKTNSQLAMEHNGAMLHSVYRQPMRDYLFRKIGKKDFGKLVDDILQPNLRVRFERKAFQFFDRKKEN